MTPKRRCASIKVKGGVNKMTIQEMKINLESPIKRISDGINALGIMTMGLVEVEDLYADGFNVIWNYLADAELDFQKQLAACLNADES